MNATDRSQLLQVLHDRRDEIAEGWYQALARTNSFIPLEAAQVRRHFVELTEQVIVLLFTEPCEHTKVQETGATLARLRCTHP